MPFKLDENMPAFHTVAQRTTNNTCFVSCVVHGFACFTFEIGSLPTRRVPLSEDVSIKMPVQTHAANCLLPNFREDLRSGSKTFYYSCSLAKPSHNSPTRKGPYLLDLYISRRSASAEPSRFGPSRTLSTCTLLGGIIVKRTRHCCQNK